MASSADATGKTSIAMVAGETSGDLLAGRLLSGLRPQLPDALMHGIGGPYMAEHGFISDFPMEKLSVRGLFEVLAHYREIKGIQIALRDQLLIERPAVFIGVDAPDFNLGLEAQLKNAGIPTMHFIGPSIWAWRGGRIKKIARAVSHMLVIFPFEEEIYRKAGIPATYVGHPLAQVIPMVPDQAGARMALGLPANTPVVALLPGSRMSELKYNAVAFVAAAKLLLQRDPSLQFVAPMAGDAQHRYFNELIVQAGLQDVQIKVIDGQSHRALAAADAVMVASGTASLEVALFKKPMVIAYKMMRASWHVLRHMGYQPWIGLPNILAQEFLVPELLQDAAIPEALADALWKQLQDGAHREYLQRRFTEMHHTLLRDTAAESARAVLELIAQSPRA
ncbi:lipid-A-disaccharide synthase [Herminiimonas fonticola]|uniref:Lipid-A-disaccharide synthase n=1 Tax=Herminiimonas fonticola TaxID=303380 RepID=A0A4V3BV96_9BURK|nr:lipid-A-disaccharide synthase [Herminiimonas fonticola]RBA24197.1 lpxB: lipid-A-disaccharide synthase [Herminiimonas fonticola]TDN90198.1 lipid-A-disaccharide synthase [Herminiimonas fonticola]